MASSMTLGKRRKRRHAAPIGGIFVVLALIGIIAVIISSLRLTERVLDNSGEKAMLEDVIRPVVMFNPVPFESPEGIEMTNLLLYSMWATLTSERAKNYTYNENQELLVPASDLDVACASLFGSGIQLEHQTFGDYYEAPYVYDAGKNIYMVRVATQLYVYSPEVREITREGEYYRLDVYYRPPANAWNTTFAGESASPFAEKHMYYYMLKNKNNWQIARVQDPPTEDAAEQPTG